ncbi:MAG TPA: DUF3306 domain-containing protein [Xanthobacteraceae bacterium]|jgi:hypothetical protein|nr:DUF3306 domain-containing protein [Xanthobacteraceae bacterium]
MTEPENFLKRWSQRKLAERERSKDEHATNQHVPAEHDALAEPPQTDGVVEANEETFDLADLPAIDSIVANTDVTAFLRPGVPADLTRAALRRAWTSDPAIRDFVGLVENGWDFNDPSAMAGFGTITADEVAKLASKIIGEPMTTNSDPPPAKTIEEGTAGPSGSPPLEAVGRKIADATKANSGEEQEAANDASQQGGDSS